MPSEAAYAAVRFGYGFGRSDVPATLDTAYARLGGSDQIAAQYPMPGLSAALSLIGRFDDARKADRAGRTGAKAALKKRRRDIATMFNTSLSHSLARIADTSDPLRERLVRFWADHFTAVPRRFPTSAAVPAYLDEAIRAHVTGRFSDMLAAAVTHPFMLAYLDQAVSMGPNSLAGRRRGRGLNENLAREVLELHTLGVGSAYSQADVRQLAELFTGLTVSAKEGFLYRPAMAEPGPETVLGKTYGGNPGRLSDIRAALEDLAQHPDTAAHVCRKLAVHFVAGEPDPDLLRHLAAAWMRSSGDLMAVYAALLEHPAAQKGFGAKAKQPFDFIASVILAVGIRGRDIAQMSMPEARRRLHIPLRSLGQPWMRPPGPDGWPEAAEHWITPHGVAGRIVLAAEVGRAVAGKVGAPADFAKAALGELASDRLLWAVGKAETRADAVALVLAAAEFNRR